MKRVTIFLIVWVCLTSAAGAAEWYDQLWAYRQKVTIDADQVDADLSNVPVVLTEDNLAAGFWSHLASGGTDLVVTSADGVTKLDHEVERIATNSQELVLWVKVPSLSATTDTDLYVYYGRPAATDEGNPAAVWSSGYRAVWHMNQSPTNDTPQIQESVRDDDGVATNMDANDLVSGKLGQCLDFDGSNDRVQFYPDDLPDASRFGKLSNWTFSAWVNLGQTGVQQDIMSSANYGANAEATIMISENNKFKLYARNHNNTDVVSIEATTALSAGSWHHLTMCRTGTTVRMYYNGQLDKEGAYNRSTTFDFVFTQDTIASRAGWGYGAYFQGAIDEIQFVDVVRSPEWISTTYANQSDPATFAASSGEEARPNPRELWYNTAWGYRLALAVDAGQVSESLTDFPLLITEANVSTSFWAHVQADGSDVLFTADDETTKLSHELETFDRNNRKLTAWVKVPQLGTNAHTLLYLYYGNPGATDQQNVADVWSSNYRAVWHLAESPTESAPQVIDSVLGQNGTCAASMDASDLVTGQVGQGLDFDGVNDVVDFSGTDDLPDASRFGKLSNWTVSAWINLAALGTTQVIHGNGNSGSNAEAAIQVTSSDKIRLIQTGHGSANLQVAEISASWTLGRWYHVALTRSNDTVRIYRDGSFLVARSFTHDNTYNYAIQRDAIGASAAYGYGDWFNGKIDEVTVATTPRSQGWIETSYANQGSPQTFVFPLGERESPKGSLFMLR